MKGLRISIALLVIHTLIAGINVGFGTGLSKIPEHARLAEYIIIFGFAWGAWSITYWCIAICAEIKKLRDKT